MVSRSRTDASALTSSVVAPSQDGALAASVEVLVDEATPRVLLVLPTAPMASLLQPALAVLEAVEEAASVVVTADVVAVAAVEASAIEAAFEEVMVGKAVEEGVEEAATGVVEEVSAISPMAMDLLMARLQDLVDLEAEIDPVEVGMEVTDLEADSTIDVEAEADSTTRDQVEQTTSPLATETDIVTATATGMVGMAAAVVAVTTTHANEGTRVTTTTSPDSAGGIRTCRRLDKGLNVLARVCQRLPLFSPAHFLRQRSVLLNS